MMTRDTNSGPAIPGDRIRLGGRKRMTPNCRDEVLVALDALVERHGDRPFAPGARPNSFLQLVAVFLTPIGVKQNYEPRF